MGDFYFFKQMIGNVEELNLHFNESILTAVWKQARMLLIPGFRAIVINPEDSDGSRENLINGYFEKLVWQIEETGEVPETKMNSLANRWRPFISKMSKTEKEILAVYFYTQENRVEQIMADEGMDDVPMDEWGDRLKALMKNVSDENLVHFCCEECIVFQDFTSTDSLENISASTVTDINENIQNYLNLENVGFEFFPRRESDYDYWENKIEGDSADDDEDMDDEDDEDDDDDDDEDDDDVFYIDDEDIKV